MSYMALYRKFRPDTFSDVKGQDHIVTTLKNQIKTERIGHAYLFCGTRGTGKTTIAKILAKAVNCENPIDGNPCGECKTCKAIAAGASMNVIEIDAASNNGVDNIREIVDEVTYSPAEGKYKVYIIDEVHMLSLGAFNALLKTLEEPPSYIIFILATTEVHKLPITILSRCQRYDFKRISIETITERLKELMRAEGSVVEERALHYIAKTADGSMRDALSLLDQCLAFHYNKELTYDIVLDILGAVDTEVFSQLLRQIINQDVKGCIDLLNDIIMQGRELTQFISDFTWYLRNLLLAKTSKDVESIIDMSSENLKKLKEEAELLEVDTMLRYIRIFSELSGQIKYAAAKRILIEVTLVKLCKPEMEHTEDSILERIRNIEMKLEKGLVVTSQNTIETTAVKNETSTKVKPKLERAVPDDVKKIVQNWQGLVAQMSQPAKNHLQTAHLSLSGDNNLLIVVRDGPPSDYYLKNVEHKEQLENALSSFLGKEVQVTIQAIQEHEDFDTSYVDLTEKINMEIETDN